jgi:hypothetical protein
MAIDGFRHRFRQLWSNRFSSSVEVILRKLGEERMIGTTDIKMLMNFVEDRIGLWQFAKIFIIK